MHLYFKVKPINYLKSVNFDNWNQQNFRQGDRDPSVGDPTCDRRPLILNHAIERSFSGIGIGSRVECTANMASHDRCLVQNCKDETDVHDHVQKYRGGRGGSKESFRLVAGAGSNLLEKFVKISKVDQKIQKDIFD